MDTIPRVIDWPKHPYRGLDFYREADTRLFCEREKDVRECADILLGFGVKILLLQGSSGSGKSSFLRAGLIPYLKRDPRQTFFLGGKDCVIRCTSDPLPEIARSLVSSFENGGALDAAPHRGGDGGGEALIGEGVRIEVCRNVEEALTGTREQLADAVLGAFVAVCADLPGKLILVLDQAEEVLTRSRGGRIGDEASAAFFRFLEDIYLRNVDARLVVALRTEYYGRFRDELRISDDRLSNRPRSGGVEPYLLRPLRDKNALMRVVETPTSACTAEGIPVYDFGFQDGLIERIVDDLVQAFPHMAVTPALQLVCASLYERLTKETRTITHADYNGLGRINGIFGSYLEQGISVAEPRTRAQVDQWHLLLHSLVSRQGGGTLVSLIEPADEIVREARELGLQSAIEPALVRLTHGAAPLLRGEPPDEPRNFSLKHDVLALVLARWYAEHEGALKAKKEEAVKRHWMLAIGIGAFAMLCLFFAFIIYDRGEAALSAKARAIDLTNRYALRAPEGSFRRSLLLALANLDATAQPSDFYEWIIGGNERIRARTLETLRELLPRTPWFAGPYQAVGVDPAGGRMALLGRDAMTVLTLPTSDTLEIDPQQTVYELPVHPRRTVTLRPAAGFLSGRGPAAFVDGYLYLWNERGERQECDIWPDLPPSITSGGWTRAEFVAGHLQVSTVERHQDVTKVRMLRLDASQLAACPRTVLTVEPLQLPDRAPSRPLPVFSDAADLPQRFEYLEETAGTAPNELAANLPVDPSRSDPHHLVELDAVISSADGHTVPTRFAVGQVVAERGIPERLHYTLAFPANAEAAVFKFDGPDFFVYDLSQPRPGNRPGYIEALPQHVAVRPADDQSGPGLPMDTRIQPARVPWAYPPLAAAQVAGHWQVAWLAPNGVWAVESSDLDPGTAKPILDAPLIGEPDAVKLQFTRDGRFLVLQWQRQQLPVYVRVWDLGSAWRGWIKAPTTTEEDLRRVACRIVRADGLGGAFSDADAELFQIDRAHQEPCPKPQGAEP